MTDLPSLLPPNSKPFSRAFEQAAAPGPRISYAADAVANIKGQALPAFLMFLLWEYGLAELTPYVPDPYQLLREGRQWQIERDTFAAVARGLGWLGLTGAVHEAASVRNFWNSFQIYLDQLPPADAPDLDRIDQIATKSTPFEVTFRRGVHGYDAGAVVADGARLDNAMLDFESGWRLRPGGPLWSFGSPYEAAHVLTAVEGAAAGHWLAPVAGQDSLSWAELNIAWQDANFAWASDAAEARRVTLATAYSGLPAYLALYRADYTVALYRRARAVRAVAAATGGRYSVGGVAYQPAAGGDQVYIEAMTGFGDPPVAIAHTAFILAPTLAAGVPPGKLTLAAGELSGGTAIAAADTALTLRPTVRQQFKTLLRF